MILVPMPDHPYYHWQARVQYRELARQGRAVTYLVYTRGRRGPSRALKRALPESAVEWWGDWRTPEEMTYNAAMKPWLVGKWLERWPEAETDAHMVLDPDAIPTEHFEMPRVTEVDWAATDTDTYTGAAYLESKNAWEPLCASLGAENPPRQGVGAQVVFTGSAAHLWSLVAQESIRVHGILSDIEPPDGELPVQAWCAEMYVMPILAAQQGIEVQADPSMDMVWAGDDIEGWQGAGFFHNAGVTEENGRDFCKLRYRNSDPARDLSRLRKVISPESASYPLLDMLNQ